jgi:hypothetical protein
VRGAGRDFSDETHEAFAAIAENVSTGNITAMVSDFLSELAPVSTGHRA